MKQPKITVITASYNAKNTIEQTISSVVNQDYPDIEYVIVDGGSIDGSVSIIEEYASSYNIKWVSEPDQGLYDALNKGVQMATGDYIEFALSRHNSTVKKTYNRLQYDSSYRKDIAKEALGEQTSLHGETCHHDKLIDFSYWYWYRETVFCCPHPHTKLDQQKYQYSTPFHLPLVK